MGQAFIVDTERWPLVYIKPPTRPYDAANPLAQFTRALELVLSRRRPLVALLDMRGVRTSALARLAMGEWAMRRDSEIRQWMVALGVLACTKVERLQVTAAFWNFDNSYHSRMVSDQYEAEHWLLSEYARHQAANHI